MNFLQQVYRHSPWMFAGMLFFAAAQLAVNYKGGMVWTPWYHYGMYSARQQPDKTYTAVRFQVNGAPLDASGWSPRRWDKLTLPLLYMANASCDSTFFRGEVERLHLKAGIPPPPFTAFRNAPPQALQSMYISWLNRRFGWQEVSIETVSLVWKNGGWQLTDSVSWTQKPTRPCP